MRWEPLRADPFKLAVGAAYMAEYEHLAALEDSPEQRTLAHRLSSYVSAQWKLSGNASAAVTAYLQPRLDAPADARARLEGELIATLGGPLSLQATASVAWDTQPPAGLPAAEIASRVALHVAL